MNDNDLDGMRAAALAALAGFGFLAAIVAIAVWAVVTGARP